MLFSVTVFAALLLDHLLGEPRRLHPLVGFGNLALFVERLLIGDARSRVRGVWAVTLLILLVLLPLTFLLIQLLEWMPQLEWLLLTLFLYLAVGGRSLEQHAGRVASALEGHNLVEARQQVALIVSRDCEALDEQGVARATVETVLENGSDAIFAPIFWYLLLGIPGVVLYRMVNTLDAMWGYRNERYQYFGWAAARLDDAMNWIPARLTALGYTIAGTTQSAWRCWRLQGRQMASPNAGVVMAAGAGALQVELGGAAQYHGEWIDKPRLGTGKGVDARDINRAIALIKRTAIIWLTLIVVLELAGSFLVG